MERSNNPSRPAKPKPILVITEQKQTYLAGPLAARGYSIEIAEINGAGKLSTLSRCLTAKFPRDHFSAIVCGEYNRTVGLALRKFLTGETTPLCVVGFNQSGRLFKSGIGLIDKKINRVLKGVDLAIVHSRHERNLWSDLHEIPVERLPFRHWGYDLPEIKSERFSRAGEEYFCLIGRNNRDIKTFAEAVSIAGTKGIVIGAEENLQSVEVPPDVQIFSALTMDECLDCIQGSVANVILVNDDSRGAGHITAVSAMHLSKPTIFTESETLRDYLISGYNGLSVPIRDPKSTASAMKQLLRNSFLREDLGQSGMEYAGRWMTNNGAADTHADLIVQTIENKSIESSLAVWQAEYEQLLRSQKRELNDISSLGDGN